VSTLKQLIIAKFENCLELMCGFLSATLPNAVRVHGKDGRWRVRAAHGGICTKRNQRNAGVRWDPRDGAPRSADPQAAQDPTLWPSGQEYSDVGKEEKVHFARPEVAVHESDVEVSVWDEVAEASAPLGGNYFRIKPRLKR
jgi:hypothetical protein